MRNRRNQGNRNFRRGPRSNKPRGMEGLPADEPDLPPPGAPAEGALDPNAVAGQAAAIDPNQPMTAEGAAPVLAEPPSTPLPPGPHLELEELQTKPKRDLKNFAIKEYEIENANALKKH